MRTGGKVEEKTEHSSSTETEKALTPQMTTNAEEPTNTDMDVA